MDELPKKSPSLSYFKNVEQTDICLEFKNL